MATLNVQAEELMRVFLFGETYVFRSWPLEALDEGLKLARNMLLGKSYVLSPSGDRVFGIQVKGGQSLPVRILWQEARAGGPARRAWIHFAPSTWNQDYAICGLGLTAEQLLRKPSTVHVFLAQDGTDTYLEGVQHLLEEHFGIDAAHTSIVGLLDGCTRARYALPMFKGRLDQMVFIGGAVADARLLANEKLRSIRIIAAYGLPKPEALKRSKQLQIESGSRKHVVFDSNELRSLSQALLRL